MRRSYNDDDAEWLANHPDYDETDYEDNDDDYFIEDQSNEDDYQPFDEDIRDPSIQPLSWMEMKLGEDTYLVSNEGHIRNVRHSIFAVSSGYRVDGTPFRAFVLRMYNVPYNIYSHDLVWRAFNGDVPHGWVVRHIDVTTDHENCYCNHVDNLRIVKLPAPNLYAGQA